MGHRAHNPDAEKYDACDHHVEGSNASGYERPRAATDDDQKPDDIGLGGLLNRCGRGRAPQDRMGRPGRPPATASITRRLHQRLSGGNQCITMHDMKTAALTIRLDPALERQLRRLARTTGRSRSELARDALRRQLAIAQFDELRRQIMPVAEIRGYLTDEDVFRDVS